MPKYLTVRDLAGMFSVAESTVRLWKKQGKITAIAVGRRLLFTESEIRRFVARGGQ